MTIQPTQPTIEEALAFVDRHGPQLTIYCDSESEMNVLRLSIALCLQKAIKHYSKKTNSSQMQNVVCDI